MSDRKTSLNVLPFCRLWMAGLLFAAVAGLLLAGCGRQQLREGFAEAYGTVTLDEKPLPNAQVEIETPGKGTSYGRTDQNGRYVAEYSQRLKGAGKGTATIRIRTNVTFADEDTSKLEYDSNLGDYRKEELVPAKYNSRSELTVEITDDGAPYDFHLTSQ